LESVEQWGQLELEVWPLLSLQVLVLSALLVLQVLQAVLLSLFEPILESAEHLWLNPVCNQQKSPTMPCRLLLDLGDSVRTFHQQAIHLVRNFLRNDLRAYWVPTLADSPLFVITFYPGFYYPGIYYPGS
jgi:hypothetical protein